MGADRSSRVKLFSSCSFFNNERTETQIGKTNMTAYVVWNTNGHDLTRVHNSYFLAIYLFGNTKRGQFPNMWLREATSVCRRFSLRLKQNPPFILGNKTAPAINQSTGSNVVKNCHAIKLYCLVSNFRYLAGIPRFVSCGTA